MIDESQNVLPLPSKFMLNPEVSRNHDHDDNDSSSSEDNLFAVNEWQHTRDRFEAKSNSNQLSPRNMLHRRRSTNSVVHTLHPNLHPHSHRVLSSHHGQYGVRDILSPMREHRAQFTSPSVPIVPSLKSSQSHSQHGSLKKRVKRRGVKSKSISITRNMKKSSNHRNPSNPSNSATSKGPLSNSLPNGHRYSLSNLIKSRHSSFSKRPSLLVRKLLPSFSINSSHKPFGSVAASQRDSGGFGSSNDVCDPEQQSPLNMSMSSHVMSNKLLLNEIIDEMAGKTVVEDDKDRDNGNGNGNGNDIVEEEPPIDDVDDIEDIDVFDMNCTSDDTAEDEVANQREREREQEQALDHLDKNMDRNTNMNGLNALNHRGDGQLVEVINALEAPQTSPPSGEKVEHKKEGSVLSKASDAEIEELPNIPEIGPFPKCDSIHRCESVKRLISCLNFYGNICSARDDNEDEEEREAMMMEYVSKYKEMMNDYHHILTHHTVNQIAFEELDRKIKKYVDCDIATCRCLFRLHREPQFGDNVEAQFVTEFIDSVHLTLCHSFDLGFRVPSALQMIDDDDDGAQQKEIESDVVTADPRIVGLKSYLAPKRQRFMTATNGAFSDCNKFNNRFGEGLEEQFKDHDESLYDADDEYIENVAGTKCFYWNHYRENEDCNVFAPSMRFKDCYVERKYSNLKHEMLSNTQCQITKQQYRLSHLKATKLMESEKMKSLKPSERRHSRSLQFDEDCDGDDTIITVQHVLAVVLYTDLAVLSHRLRSSFFKLHWESHAMFIARKREFWHWTKLLLETIQLYGDTQDWNKSRVVEDAQVFYTAVSSKVLIDSFGCNFDAPMSVSTELAVPLMMADHHRGHILELQSSATQYPWSLFVQFLDTRFVSKFGFEQEMVFMAGSPALNDSLRIRSILSLSNGKVNTECVDYRVFVRAIDVFCCAVTGRRGGGGPTATDCKVIDHLIAHRIGVEKEGVDFVGNGYPQYINDLFDHMLIQQKSIRIDVDLVHSIYGDLKDYLLCSVADHDDNDDEIELVAFKFLFGSLFKYCTEIAVEMSTRRSVMSTTMLQVLAAIMVQMNETNLRTIKLSNVANRCDDEMAIRRFKIAMAKMEWDLDILVEKNHRNRRHDRHHKHKSYQYVLRRKERTNLTEKFKNMFISR